MSVASTIATMLLAASAWIPGVSSIDAKQVECMARTIWGEARGDIPNSQHVAHVVLNRSRVHGESVCAVVSKRLQFGGYRKKVNPLHPEWFESVEVAILAMTGLLIDHTNGATHFLNAKDPPQEWERRMVFVGRSGKHYYYKEAD